MLGQFVKALGMLLVFLSVSSWCAAGTAYRLQPGDIIEVSVWKEQDLQRELLVSPDGQISFPLIGHIQASGLSVKTLNAQISQRLSKFIPDPSVTVLLKNTSGNQYFVMGKVNRPGQYPMLQPTSVLQALSVAGGTTTYAKTDEIKVIRHGRSQQAISFNYDRVKEGRSLEQNIQLRSGDVVVVP